MKILNGGNIVRLVLTDIHVENRLRQTSEDQVTNLMLMAEDTGITTPIHVRKVGAKYHLIDGAHRMEAARRLGMADIAALVVECRQEEARAMEASNNLGAARMTPLQTAVFVASWKKSHYEMHPERKPGVFKGNQHTKKLVGVNLTLTRNVALAFGVSDATASRFLAAGERLTGEETQQIEKSALRVPMQELQTLAKIAEPEERAFCIAEMLAGKGVAPARNTWKAKRTGVQPNLKDPVEDAFNALVKLWSRAPKAAKRRFVAQMQAELSALLDDEGNIA
ncbi:MAG: ParB/RepB/Spo0J family partition protein [Cypionkella sp.]